MDATTETIPPVTPAPTTAPNVPTSETPITVEGSTLEKIRTSGAKIFASAGQLFKRGRGRPRKDGQPALGDLPLSDAPPGASLAQAAIVSADGKPVDPNIVKRCVSACLKTATGILNKILYKKAVKKTGDVKFAAELCRDCTVTPEELDSFSELAEICLRKHGVGTQYAPEIGLSVIALGIGARYAAAFADLSTVEPKPQAA